MSEDYSDEQRAMIVRVRSRLGYIDTLAEPEKSLAIAGVPEADWSRYIVWITEAARLIRHTEKALR